MYRTIDLCAGIGGIRRGFEKTLHYTNVFSVENNEYAARTYEHLFGDNPRFNLTTQECKDTIAKVSYDILLSGFPCQPFSSQGNKEGFSDPTKGTVFFHLKEIISTTRPKVVFLENVQNIVSHDNRNTINTIIDTLENILNYKVIGVSRDHEGHLIYNKDSFVRNTKDFGLPQNRPRAFFIAFDRDLYGDLLDAEGFVNELPRGLSRNLLNDPLLGKSLNNILEDSVDLHYYISATYLKTLELHAERQKNNGNGFGYYILNSPEHNRSYANTIMATGGSGKERNLIIQNMPEHTSEDENRLRKKGGLNKKNVRIMTPTEWGRLQGFIGYGFVDPETGEDSFSFPDGMPEGQQYKQFGNAVSIPVIETLAQFIYDQLRYLNKNYEQVLRNLAKRHGYITRSMIAACLDVTPEHSSYVLKCLQKNDLLLAVGKGKSCHYIFK